MTKEEFDKGQEAIIEKIAWEVGEKICAKTNAMIAEHTKALKEHTATQIELHYKGCPVKDALADVKKDVTIFKVRLGAIVATCTFLGGCLWAGITFFWDKVFGK